MPKRVRRTLFLAKRVSVNVCSNDSVDIKCGGPPTLGFDFFVDQEMEDEEIERFIKKQLKKNRMPCQSVFIDDSHETQTLWTKKMIRECIENYHIPSSKRL